MQSGLIRTSILAFVLYLFFVTPSSAQDATPLKITHLPYIQALTDTSVSIIWTTNKPAVAWVELAPDDSTHFYLEERPRTFASDYGFKKVGTVHQVDLSGLAPGTRYRYRVYSQEVLKHEGAYVEYGRIVATNVYRQQPLEFSTLGPANQTRFVMINDIHGRNEVMNKLLDIADLESRDFVVFNGDMTSMMLSEDQMYEDFMETAIERFASEMPFFYSRGNHETRGPFAVEYPKYFPTPTGELYFMFRHGDAAFVVLDCGEDKPDSDLEYSGIVVMDEYRTRQARWLARVVRTPAFRDAKYKIAICHMPPFGGWHGEMEILEKFVPILNEAGVQVMLSGHLHRHVIHEADEQIHFPVIVNSNNHVLTADLTEEAGVLQIQDLDGKLVAEVRIGE